MGYNESFSLQIRPYDSGDDAIPSGFPARAFLLAAGYALRLRSHILLINIAGGALMRLIFWRICALSFSVILAGCPVSGPQSVKSYIDSKKEFINALEESIGLTNQYRLAFIPPLIEPYVPGMPLEKGSYKPLTDSCVIKAEYLPSKVPVSPPPASESKRTFNLNAGIPNLLAKAIKGVADLKGAANLGNEAVFMFYELAAINVRDDRLRESVMNSACLNAIAGKDIIMIRGIISGKEAISSKRSFGGDAQVKLLKDEAVIVKYDSSGGYEVKDSEVSGKFWFVSEWNISIPGLSPDTPYQKRLGLIDNFLRAETRKSDLVTREKRPDDRTLQELAAALEGKKGNR